MARAPLPALGPPPPRSQAYTGGVLSPRLSSAFSLQCRRHYGSTQASLSFYGRKMNCSPSSGAERDDRTESCHLLWFWQKQKRAFSLSHPGMDSARQAFSGRKATLAKLLPEAFLPCLACEWMCLFMNIVSSLILVEMHFLQNKV